MKPCTVPEQLRSLREPSLGTFPPGIFFPTHFLLSAYNFECKQSLPYITENFWESIIYWEQFSVFKWQKVWNEK